MHASSHLVFVLLSAISALRADSGGNAAVPYGRGSSGTVGGSPQAWIEGGPYAGNNGFAFTIARGRPGAVAVAFLALAPASIPWGNHVVLLDPASPFFGPIGSTVLSAAGTGQVPFPLPPNPGLSLYVQWVVVDPSAPSGIVLSDGLRVIIRDGELVIGVGRSRVTGFVPPGPPWVATMSYAGLDIQLSPNGRLAFTIGPDARYPEVFAVFSTLSTAPAPMVTRPLSSGNRTVLVHPDARSVYIVRMVAGGGLQIDQMDVDPASTQFGMRVGIVTGLPTLPAMAVNGASISADGRRVVVAASDLTGTARLVVVDVDPGSAARNTHLATHDVSVSGYYLADAEVSADGQLAYLSHGSIAPGGIVSVVSTVTGVLRQSRTHGEATPVDMDIDPRGRFLVAAYGASRALGVIDLQAGPTYLQQRTIATGVQGQFLALSPDAGKVVVTGNLGDWEIYELGTGRLLWVVVTGICTGIAWR